MKKQLLFAVLLLVTALGISAKEPYTVLSDDYTTLTFYYDDQCDSRGGSIIRGYYHNPILRAWDKSVIKVVFDSSFADYEDLTSTKYWFFELENLTSIVDIENLKTTNVTDMAYMFYKCSSLTNLDLSHFNTSNVTNMYAMFGGCESLTSLELGDHFYTSNVTNMYAMFSGCESLRSLELGDHFNTSNVTDMSFMFSSCKSLTSIEIETPFQTFNVTDMSAMFFNCESLTRLNLSTFNTSKVENMRHMFSGCKLLTDLNINNFETASVDTMDYMFLNCETITSLNISNFNTSKVASMQGMFAGCHQLANLDINNFNTKNVSNFEKMFAWCYELKTLDISSFSTESLVNIKEMFYLDNNLKTIYVGDLWNTQNVTEGDEVFRGCANLIGGKGTKWNPEYIDVSYAHIDGGLSNPGYFTSKGQDIEDDPYDLPIISKARTITFSSFMNSSTNIKGNIIDGIYYNFPSNNGYDSSAGCLTFNNISNWPVGLKPGDLTTKNQFTGIIMKLVGKGVIYAEGQLSGNMYLGSTYDDYKIGSEFFSENYRTKTSIGEYDFDEPTYVYIHTTTFGETLSSNSKAKLWSIEIRPSSATTDNVKITANDITMTYGSNVPRLTFSTSGSELQGTPELSTTANAKSPVGTYKIIVNKGSVSNSSVELIDGTLTITKAPLTISVGEYNKVEGEDNPEFVLTYNGFKNNETEAVLTKRPVITTSATKDSESGEYAITVSGAEAENYDITYVAGKLTVKAKPEPEPEPDPKPVIVIEPVETTTMNSESLRGQDLTNNVIDGIYYNVGEDGYDRSDWSVVISQPTNMAQVENKEPGSEDVKEKFNGIIMRVANGKGLIIVKAKTSGIAQLAVQVGNSTPMTASCTEKGDMEVSYDINEDTYVYIYAILDSSNAPTRASSDGEVRIYGIKVSPGAVSGITNMKSEITTDNRYYNLSGQRRTQLHKGINIVRPAGGRLQGKNGKKVFVP